MMKHIRSRKTAREVSKTLDDKVLPRLLKDREIAEKLNELFALIFTADDVGQTLIPKLFLEGMVKQSSLKLATATVRKESSALGTIRKWNGNNTASNVML